MTVFIGRCTLTFVTSFVIADIRSTARRAIVLAAMIELPLIVTFAAVGVPTGQRPNVFAVVLGLSQLPGILLLDPRIVSGTGVSSASVHPAFASTAAIGVANALLLALVLHTAFRMWHAWTVSSRAPRPQSAANAR